MTLADLASAENGRVHRPRQVFATERRGKRAGAALPRRKLGATEVHIFVTQRLCVIFPCCSDARRARARSMAQDDCASCLSRLPPGRLLRAFSALGRLPAPLSQFPAAPGPNAWHFSHCRVLCRNSECSGDECCLDGDGAVRGRAHLASIPARGSYKNGSRAPVHTWHLDSREP